ncbi:MAG: DUF3883 domain-containing protein [Archaeoglobaceae archaeon]|nr:DUF3883 domain-containing protein [Archaeoglobaceae archaeon]
MIVQNDEIGFKEDNVWALCKIGGSTKTNKSLGYIGGKGIGFKSVFMVADEVQIFSNGFQFRFKYDKNDPLTMLIPEWIEHAPDFVDPTQTNIILVLNDESKAKASRYLDDVHPNLLLFLRKLKIIEIEDKTREKEWISEFSPEEVPVVIEEYDVQKQIQPKPKKEMEKYNEKSPLDETYFESTTSPTDILSRKTREDIGRWGEEYTLKCIKHELMKRYPDAIVLDTKRGFRLERSSNVVIEVIWENRKCESGKPYGIKIIENEEETFIEVKVTPSTTKETFQLSENEWSFMQEKGDRYWIYRVYGAGERSLK